MKTRIWPRSSFRSVPFGKKGIVTLSFRSFESFLNAWSEWTTEGTPCPGYNRGSGA